MQSQVNISVKKLPKKYQVWISGKHRPNVSVYYPMNISLSANLYFLFFVISAFGLIGILYLIYLEESPELDSWIIAAVVAMIPASLLWFSLRAFKWAKLAKQGKLRLGFFADGKALLYRKTVNKATLIFRDDIIETKIELIYSENANRRHELHIVHTQGVIEIASADLDVHKSPTEMKKTLDKLFRLNV